MLGVSRRSGTNFLAGLLLCHRDCAAPAPPVAEDHLLREIPTLERYVARTARHWPRRWGDRDAGAADLRAALGEGLLRFLTDRSDGRRTVSRTPSTAHLTRAPRWYAGADVVLLVRDGRSVAASFAAAWGWPLELAALEWRRGARRIIGLDAPTPIPDAARARFLLVRYEDVLADTEGAIARLLDFTGLDPAGFDHEAARRLPVLGSSYLRDEHGRVTWEPRPPSADFDPAHRHAGWSRAQRERFDWLAGAEQRALGYERDDDPPRGVGDRARMIALDATLPVRHAPLRARRALANALRSGRSEWRARTSAQPPDAGAGGTSSSTSSSTTRSSASGR